MAEEQSIPELIDTVTIALTLLDTERVAGDTDMDTEEGKSWQE